jgi:hypothetical protein
VQWELPWKSLEENRALNCIITALAEQAKQVTVKVQQARQGAANASQDAFGVGSSSVSLTTGERNDVPQIAGINTQLFQLSSSDGWTG